MTFSILTPVYNAQAYLETTLAAVLAQSYTDYEWLLIDDGSTDESGRICDEFATRYPNQIRVIHKQNQGPLAARVLGVREASGDYCVFLDADDGVETDWLQTIADHLVRQPDIDILLYSFRYMRDGVPGEKGAALAEDGFTFSGDGKKTLYGQLIDTNALNSLWTKAIRTSILKNDPTDYSVYYGNNMGEDLLQALYPVTVADKIVYIDRPLYRYRVNAEGVSRSFHPDTISSKSTLFLYHAIVDCLSAWGMDDAPTKERLAARWMNDTMYTFCRYYEGAATGADRRAVLAFDWNSFLPSDAMSGTLGNPAYCTLYRLWREGRHGAIRRFFLRRKFKTWKKRIRGK